MRKNNRCQLSRPILIAILTVLLVLCTGIGTAWAYFTSYATAKGTYTLELGDSTEIIEKVKEGKKEVTIKVSKDSEKPVFVRVIGYCGDDYTLVYNYEFDEKDNKKGPLSLKWVEKENGYWQYSEPVEPTIDKDGQPQDAFTEPLIVSIRDKDGKKIDATKTGEDHHFNVIIYYETIPAGYNEDGTVKEPNWEKDSVTVYKTFLQ